MLVAGSVATAAPAAAQATVGADLALFSSYVWRGLSLTNKPVAEPDVYVTFPAGKASVTLGGWANIDLGRYDDPNNDISESGGTSGVNFAEFDWWGEVSYAVGKATLTGGATGYIYPNDANAAGVGLLTKESNTVEIYGKAEFEVPLSPSVAAWYDVDKIKGLYVEGSISHTVPASEKVGVTLGALAGVSAGQGVNTDPNSDQSANFADDGFTHLDLSAAVDFSAGMFSFSPALHLVINGDDFTKATSPTKTKDAKLWGGVTISWSRTLGPAPEAAEEAE